MAHNRRMNSYPILPPRLSPRRRRSSTSSPSMSACAPFCGSNFCTPKPRITANRPMPGVRAPRCPVCSRSWPSPRAATRAATCLKELERQVNVLKEYQSKTGVDPGRLKSLMSNLVKLRNDLSNIGGNYMAPLRDSEFLSAVKHRSAIPGGTCDFDLPDYSYWLNRPAEIRGRRVQRLAGIDPAFVRQHRGTAVDHPSKRQAQIGSGRRRHLPAAVRSRESVPIGARHLARRL